MSHPSPEQQPAPAQTPVYEPGAAAVPQQNTPESVAVAGAEATTATPGDGAPVSAPAYGTPVSGPAYGTPVSGPAYGTPVSGPAYGAPVSGPAYGAPYPAAPEAPKRGKGGIITLSIVSFLLLLSTFGVTTLYFVERGDHSSTKETVSKQLTTLDDNKKALEDLQKKIDATKAELAKANTDLTSSKEDVEELTKAKNALVGCFKAMSKYFQSNSAANRSALVKACTAADPYIS